MIAHTIEINRSPEDVFAYIDELDRHGEWQSSIVSARIETPGPVRVGTRCVEVRAAGGREQEVPYEITEHDPPRWSAFKGTGGPVRPIGTVLVEPMDDPAKARLTVEFDLVGYGLTGKLLAPIARSQARKQVVHDHEQLKARLEGGA